MAERLHYEKLFLKNQGNSYKTWSIVGELINYKNHKNKSKIPPTIEIEKKLYETNSSAFLNKLCEYFANIGANMCQNLLNSDKADSKLVIHSLSCIQSFVFYEITKAEVTRHINAIKTHMMPGLDGISSKFIKLAKLIVAPFLAQLFNNCINQNLFPENFKSAIVTPIPKTSSP